MTRPSNELFVSFDIRQLYNTFIQALLSNLLLVFSMSGVCTVVMLLTGKVYNDTITYNPMFCSISVQDFWSNRWNTLIHTSLKQGIYKPIRFKFTNNNKHIAYFGAFMMSGIIHELVWKILFYQTTNEIIEFGQDCNGVAGTNNTCYVVSPSYGKQIIFFSWNGILLVLENTKYGQQILCWGQKHLPRLVLGHLIVLLSLPVGHLFTGDVTISGSYHHAHYGFFLIKYVLRKS